MESKIKNTKDSKKQSSLPVVHKILGPKVVGSQQYIPKPPLEEEKRRIYQSQILIPTFISGKTHVIAGPLKDVSTNLVKLKEYFPTFHRHKPIASGRKSKSSNEDVGEEPTTIVDTQTKLSTEPIETTITLDYLSIKLRVFRSCPLFKEPKNYLSWHAKIEKHKAQV